MAQEGFWVEESLGSSHSIRKPDTHPFLILKVVTVTLSLLGEQVERRDSELLHNALGQINLLPSVWNRSFSRVLHELLWGVYYAQLGKKIFVGIFGLMEHILSLVSLGLFIFRVWFGLVWKREKEMVIIALFSGLFGCVVGLVLFFPPLCSLK